MNIRTPLKINALSIALAASLFSQNLLADNHKNLERRVTALEAQVRQNPKPKPNLMTLGGLIEIDAHFVDRDSESSQSDLIVSTAELSAEATLSAKLSAQMTLLYEEALYGEEGDGVDVDIASLNYKHNNSLSFTLGQDYVPFGSFSTVLVYDPLPLQLGETRETAFIANYESGLINASLYLFNGDQDKGERERLNNFGARIGLTDDRFSIGVDYISNFADSDGLQDNDYGFGDDEDIVDGFSFYGAIPLSKLNLALEHMSALDELANDGNDSEPSATQFEAAFNAGKITYALSYQESDEALFLDLPEERISLGLNTEIFDTLGLGLELAMDEDYSEADGGSGDSTNSVVLRLGAEF